MEKRLVYSICYYYGNNKISNILNHLDAFNRIKINKQFILVNMVDSDDINYINNVENNLSDIIKNYNNDINFKILSSFNSGGTILALWITYNYNKFIDDNLYVAHFEEDFHPNNNDWLEQSILLLNNNNKKYIYIGEHIPSATISTNVKNTKLEAKYSKPEWDYIINKYYKIELTHFCWTDGGFYFSTIQNLKIIENKIGIFHKGTNKKYNHYIDGIVLGEVGFPTILHNNNFNFYGLERVKYFTHNE